MLEVHCCLGIQLQLKSKVAKGCDAGLKGISYNHCISFISLYVLHFPGGSDGKESACNMGEEDSIPGSRISPGEESRYPLKYSCLENPMDRGAWKTTVHKIDCKGLSKTERTELLHM